MTEAEVIQACGTPANIRRHSWGTVSLDYQGATVVIENDGGVTLAARNAPIDRVARFLKPEVPDAVR